MVKRSRVVTGQIFNIRSGYRMAKTKWPTWPDNQTQILPDISLSRISGVRISDFDCTSEFLQSCRNLEIGLKLT